MSFGQVVIQFVTKTFLDHSVLYIGLLVLMIFGLDFYRRFVKINKDLDPINVTYLYTSLLLRRRYRGYFDG